MYEELHAVTYITFDVYMLLHTITDIRTSITYFTFVMYCDTQQSHLMITEITYRVPKCTEI